VTLPVLAAGVLVLLGGCGGSGDDTSSQAGAGQGSGSQPSAVRGEQIAGRRKCFSCHSTDGKILVGPTWKGLAGTDRKLTDGRTVKADQAYLDRAIRDPDAETVEGFRKGAMRKGIKKRLSDAEIADLVAYVRTQ
jgi:cytochrome c oxidase subunit 2